MEAEEEMKSSSELELIYSSFSGVRPLKLMAKIGQRRRRCGGEEALIRAQTCQIRTEGGELRINTKIY